MTHGLHGHLVRKATVAPAHRARRSNGRFFDDPDEFQGKLFQGVFAERLLMQRG